MKIANNITATVFCKEGEDDEVRITEVFLKLFPFDLEQEKIILEKTIATGLKERKIRILKVVLAKDRHTNTFLENLRNNLEVESKELLLRQLESRLDEELTFFIRLDKTRLLRSEFFITDSGDCFHIAISVAAFPRKRENAIRILEEFFA